MTEPWAGLSDLSTLVGPRLLTLKDSDEPGAEHSRDCDYEWRLRVTEWGLRLDGLLTTLHNSPHQAYAEASTLRDEIVAAGFEEIYRCEVTAARVEDMEDHATLGWRGRIDLGLRRRSR